MAQEVTVSGCGMPEFNGVYRTDTTKSGGVVNGKPCYRRDGGDQTINFSSGNWYMCKNHSGFWYAAPPSTRWHAPLVGVRELCVAVWLLLLAAGIKAHRALTRRPATAGLRGATAVAHPQLSATVAAAAEVMAVAAVDRSAQPGTYWEAAGISQTKLYWAELTVACCAQSPNGGI
eukprot:COSAG01_NODE_6180_length_3806_cov_35.350958_2_plen_175_part_00